MLALVINCCGGSQKGRRRHSQLFHNSESSRGKRTEDQGGLEGWSGKLSWSGGVWKESGEEKDPMEYVGFRKGERKENFPTAPWILLPDFHLALLWMKVCPLELICWKSQYFRMYHLEKGLCRHSWIKWGHTGVSGPLIQYDWCPYKMGKFPGAHTQGKSCVRMKAEIGWCSRSQGTAETAEASRS